MVCPSCGKENPNHAISCLGCGASLVPGLPPVRAQAVPVPSPAPTPARPQHGIGPLILILAVLFLLAGSIAYITVHRNKQRAIRAERYQVLSTQVEAVAADFDQTNQAIDNLLQQQPKDFAAWQGFTRQLLALVDTYEQHVDKMTDLLATIDREQVASSDAERNQIRVLQSVFKLRKQQAIKLRQMGNTILAFDPRSGNLAQFQAQLQDTEKQVSDLDAQAKQQLSTIGFE